MMDERNGLISNLDKLHTTDLGKVRIKRNLRIDVIDVVEWCKKKIAEPHCETIKRGKNFYSVVDGYIITINSHSYTIITAHKIKK